MVLKNPPTYTVVPDAASAAMVLLGFGLNVADRTPVAASTAPRKLRAIPPSVVNVPPTYSVDPDRAIAETLPPVAPGLNPASARPVAPSSAAIRERAWPPTFANWPPAQDGRTATDQRADDAVRVRVPGGHLPAGVDLGQVPPRHAADDGEVPADVEASPAVGHGSGDAAVDGREARVRRSAARVERRAATRRVPDGREVAAQVDPVAHPDDVLHRAAGDQCGQRLVRERVCGLGNEQQREDARQQGEATGHHDVLSARSARRLHLCGHRYVGRPVRGNRRAVRGVALE